MLIQIDLVLWLDVSRSDFAWRELDGSERYWLVALSGLLVWLATAMQRTIVMRRLVARIDATVVQEDAFSAVLVENSFSFAVSPAAPGKHQDVDKTVLEQMGGSGVESTKGAVVRARRRRCLESGSENSRRYRKKLCTSLEPRTIKENPIPTKEMSEKMNDCPAVIAKSETIPTKATKRMKAVKRTCNENRHEKHSTTKAA